MTAEQTEEERLQMFRRYHEMSLEELEAIRDESWLRLLALSVLGVSVAIIVGVVIKMIWGTI